MDAIIDTLWAMLRDEAAGLIGGALFLGSWVLQGAESRRAGKPVVSIRFFAMRAGASALLAIEGLRSGSLSIFAVMTATGLLMLYNIALARKNQAMEQPGEEGG